MGTIGERIDFLIKEKEKNRSRFAERVGVSPAYITMLIGGKNEPSDLVITSICREYRVSEEWLRHGVGEMFIPTPQTEIDKLCEHYNLEAVARVVIEKFVTLPDEDRKVILSYVSSVAKELGGAAPASKTIAESTDKEIADAVREGERIEKEVAEASEA